MTKAYGYNAKLLGKMESSFGEDPGGNYVDLPFKETDLGETSGLITDQLAGQGRDPLQHFKDVNVVGGNVLVPVDERYFGYWLELLLGDPVTTEAYGGGAPYTHVFKSNGTSLPSMAAEVGHIGPSRYELNLGVMATSLQLSHTPEAGGMEASIGLVGISQDQNDTTQGGTPSTLTLRRFSRLEGVLKKNGSNYADITGFSLDFQNGLEVIRDVNGAGDAAAIDLGPASVSGVLNTRFTSEADMNAAEDNSSPFRADLVFTDDSDANLTFTVYDVHLEKPKAAIRGPGGYGVDFPFRGAKNTSAGCAFAATLVNDQAGTVYTGW